MMNWVKNLSRPMLPARKQGQRRIWGLPSDLPLLRNRTDEDTDYQSALNEAHLSSSVMACVEWIATMLPRCPWKLERRTADGWEQIDMHPVLDLLQRPTPWHSGRNMFASLLVEWNLGGTAYAQRVSTRQSGPPQELWYTPASMVRPRWNSRGLEGWDYYNENGQWDEYPPETFLQLRRRQSPANPFLGVSPLSALGMEVWMEREGKKMTSAVLGNMGIIGLILSLKDSDNVEVTQDGVRAFKDYMRAEWGGNNRGNPMFAEFPVDVHGLTASDPDMVHPKNIHDFVQAAVCQAYRLPAAVVQFGLGIEQTTENATLTQYEKQAWQTGLIPVGDDIQEQLSWQLLPTFGLDVKTHRLCLDYSSVEVLQEDEQTKMDMLGTALARGGIMRSEFREAFNYPVEETDKVYHLGLSIIEVPGGMSQLEQDEQRRDTMTPEQLKPENQSQSPQDGESDLVSEPPDAAPPDPTKSAGKALSARQRQNLLRGMNDDTRDLTDTFAADLEEIFAAMGESAGEAAAEVMSP